MGLAHAQRERPEPARHGAQPQPAAGQRPPRGRLPAALWRRDQFLQLQQHSCRCRGAHRSADRRRVGDLWFGRHRRRGQRHPEDQLRRRRSARARRHVHRRRARYLGPVLGGRQDRRQLERHLRPAVHQARSAVRPRPAADGRRRRCAVPVLEHGAAQGRLPSHRRPGADRPEHRPAPGTAGRHLREIRWRVLHRRSAGLQLQRQYSEQHRPPVRHERRLRQLAADRWLGERVGQSLWHLRFRRWPAGLEQPGGVPVRGDLGHQSAQRFVDRRCQRLLLGCQPQSPGAWRAPVHPERSRWPGHAAQYQPRVVVGYQRRPARAPGRSLRLERHGRPFLLPRRGAAERGRRAEVVRLLPRPTAGHHQRR
ncbi:hypothetical protein D3C72_1086800 [compost metagenome]